MTRGIVIGKFLPIHSGHVALINFAAQHADEVIVSMSYTDDDPIPHTLRFEWIRKIFAHESRITVKLIADDFDQPELTLQRRTKIWAEELTRAYGSIDYVFSSETYGDPLAKNLSAQHLLFDQDRSQFPVSSSKIREQPFKYWAYIPDVVKPYFVKKICFFGAESTGKSTMAKRMAEKYHTVFVPEVARELITSNDFTIDDIRRIGYAQFDRVMEASRTANKILFCDTDAITTQIYSQHYLNEIPEELYELEERIQYDQYFLLDVDVPWVEDGLRDLPHLRHEMAERFRSELVKRKIPFVDVKGTWPEREAVVAEVIDRMLH